VTAKEDLETAFAQLFDHQGPALLEVQADVKLI